MQAPCALRKPVSADIRAQSVYLEYCYQRAGNPHCHCVGMGVSPEPVLMTVASPVNILMLAPGNYRFLDFAKLGVPLQLLAMGVVIWLTPLLFPF
ncbi:hypothetical protein SAMN04487869_1402 [Marinobacter sp. DSM 26671]|jgi:hypothetical protein|nr:hypothetical protein SAMN04487869_1402 [Marinobacter sp. DSM 26671]